MSQQEITMAFKDKNKAKEYYRLYNKTRRDKQKEKESKRLYRLNNKEKLKQI